ncbi:MAG: arginine repressor [Actinomycetaceae bacterium]|nr:arginine repressor [Actinomycetaceae bacterium]
MKSRSTAVPTTRTARQALIAQLLAERSVHSQGELRTLVKEAGFSVTQATLSRDLDELNAIKVRDSTGNQIYRIPDEYELLSAAQGARAQLERWCPEVLVSVQQALNQLVLRTPSGGAHLLAGGVDKARIPGVLGCIAGDDTVLIIAESDERATQLKQELLSLA